MRGGAGQAQCGRCDVSAPEQPQGVLLRYAGGEVYAVPEARAGGLTLRVAGVSVAVSPLEPCPVLLALGGFETTGTLTDLVAAGEHHRRMEREAAEHARVALEMERTPKRPTKAKRVAKRTGKGKAKRTGKGKAKR